MCSYNAAAPLTISMISFVILAWRARFITRVSESIMSLALLVAESIAVMRAACSAATDCRIMLTICASMVRGKSAPSSSRAGGSKMYSTAALSASARPRSTQKG